MTRVFKLLIVSAGLMLPQAALAQVIRVNKEAAVDTHQDVRLGDVATVSGADAKTAESLANIVILPDAKESRTLRAEAVLMAVLAQIGPGKLADKLEIAGTATCDIRVAEKTKIETTVAKVETAKVENQAVPPRPAEIKPAAPKSEPTLSKVVIEEVQRNLGAGPDDVRISFTTINPLLDAAAPEGQRRVLRPLTRAPLGSVQFEAQNLEGGRIVQKLNLQAQVLQREHVMVIAQSLSRGDVVTKSHVKSQETWMDRQLSTLLQQEKDVVGLEALRPISVGSFADQRDFKAVEMAARNESISVIFLQGNLTVKNKATAMQGGKLHDSIQVKSDTNETYQATLIGKRLAVVGQLTEKLELELREAR